MVRNWIRNQYLTILTIVTSIIFFTLGVVFYLKSPIFHPQLKSIISPTKVPEASEPDIDAWTTYSNKKYNFAIEVPAKWHEQDYSAFFGNNSALIAFSPKPLPCEMCSYLHDGYFSVRIYNEQTDPELYKIYSEKLEDPEKNEVEIGSKMGVSFANSVAVENQGWIYELSLDKDEGTAKIADSKIFQRVVSSFRFTSIFN